MCRETDHGLTMRRLNAANNRINGAYYVCARRMGANENLVEVLYALDEGPERTQKQICEEWMIPKTTVNTVVRELVREGYATLAARGREKIIVLTDAGRAYARRLLAPMKTAETRALARTLRAVSADFVEAYDFFARCLCEELQRDDRNEREETGDP